MSVRVPTRTEQLRKQTLESLHDLKRALNDSINFYTEAAERMDNDRIESVFHRIAEGRKTIADRLGEELDWVDETPIEDDSFLGSLRMIWTKYRGGSSSGSPAVVLIEAERAEGVILKKLRQVIPETAGNPISAPLLEHFEKFRMGHDRVVALRSAFQRL
jgi:uncharacterized protein (TIGR02284 family)